MKPQIRSTQELAHVLGMSRWTVSRALNGHAGLSAETVARVLAAARDHGFSPSILGRGLRQGRTKLIGICLPDLVDYFLTDKVARLQKAVESRGFHPLFQMNTGSVESENAALERFASMHCAGIVIIASRLRKNAPACRNLDHAGVPVIRIDPLHEKTSGVVSTDRAQAMQDALAYLKSLGHRRISIFGICDKTAFGCQRIQGLKMGLKKREGSFRWFSDDTQQDDFTEGTEMARRFLREPLPKTTAILALNDRVALGAMRVLLQNGIRIPEDVSILGYDNADFSAYTEPGLTTIDPHVSELIDQAMARLFSDQGGPSRALSGEKPILVQPSLVIRKSCGPVSARLA